MPQMGVDIPVEFHYSEYCFSGGQGLKSIKIDPVAVRFRTHLIKRGTWSGSTQQSGVEGRPTEAHRRARAREHTRIERQAQRDRHRHRDTETHTHAQRESDRGEGKGVHATLRTYERQRTSGLCRLGLEDCVTRIQRAKL